MTTTKPQPPIRCTPCRVTYEGIRYRVYADGSISNVMARTESERLGLKFASAQEVLEYEKANLPRHAPDSKEARDVRREASRLRRNRNARERHQAMRDVGMTKTSYGWE